MTARLARVRTTVSRMITSDDIESYWEKYTMLFPKEREKVWDSLFEGLKRYHDLLKSWYYCKVMLEIKYALEILYYLQVG